MKFGLLGFPIDYSLSPQIYREFAIQFEHHIDYQLIPTTADNLAERIVTLQQTGYRGVNITQPLKRLVLQYAGLQSKSTRLVQAANVLSFEPDGSIKADNTDGIGFYHALQKHVSDPIKNKTVLLIGCGGAARGILPQLFRLQPKKIILLNRTPAPTVALLKQYAELVCFDSEQSYDWIINATSIPCYELPNSLPSLTFAEKIIYDLTYNHDMIRHQQFVAQYKPAALYDGRSMLIEQAAVAYSIWYGVVPKTNTLMNRLIVHRKK